jgi:hypothetical protein
MSAGHPKMRHYPVVVSFEWPRKKTYPLAYIFAGVSPMAVFMLVIGIAQTLLMIWQVKLASTPTASLAGAPVVRQHSLRYLPVLGMGILAAISWIPYFFHIGQPEILNVIRVWGGTYENCYVTIDGTGLMKYRDEYNLYSSCGVVSSTVDKFQNEVIAISNPFSISKDQISIDVRYTPAMLEIFKAIGTPPMQSKVPSVWAQPFLLPKNVNVSRIKRLSDVHEFGGKIIQNCEAIE